MTDKRTEKQKETNSYPAVYGHSLNYAIEHGEMEEYKASRKLNRECKEAVEETIRQNFDGMNLKSDIVKGDDNKKQEIYFKASCCGSHG